MKEYIEFKNYEKIEDKANPFCQKFKLETGETFYIEPLFYTYLENFKEQFVKEVPSIINEMIRMVKANKKVIFSGLDEEVESEPATKTEEDYIVITFFDITNKLGILLEDKSRGSDYGD